MSGPLFGGVFAPLGYQQITTALSAATKLTVPAGALYALIQAEAQNVRWRDDGVAPTTSVGMLMVAANDPLGFAGELTVLQFIAATDGAILNVSYYGA